MTDKLIERTVVKIWGDELFSVVLTDDEFNALTADQLREAVTAYSCQIVVRRADGTFSMIDWSGCDGIVDDVIAALQRDRNLSSHSFTEWSLTLADLRARIAERIANEIEGHVDRETVLLELKAVTGWKELLDA
jgi:hypothetical protein